MDVRSKSEPTRQDGACTHSTALGPNANRSTSVTGLGTEETQLSSHEPTTSKLITDLSEAFREVHARLIADGVLCERDRTALQMLHDVSIGLQELDDDMAEGFAIARYGEELEYHERRRKSTATRQAHHGCFLTTTSQVAA
jgi:hypothetical protein